MAIQTLTCNNGGHSWTRETKRGRQPKLCPDHAPDKSPKQGGRRRKGRPAIVTLDSGATVIDSGSVLSGEALTDRLMFMLGSRGLLLSQQTSHMYAGPRW